MKNLKKEKKDLDQKYKQIKQLCEEEIRKEFTEIQDLVRHLNNYYNNKDK
jgi:hypothetical protein